MCGPGSHIFEGPIPPKTPLSSFKRLVAVKGNQPNVARIEVNSLAGLVPPLLPQGASGEGDTI